MNFETQFAKAIITAIKEKGLETTDENINGVLEQINKSIKTEIKKIRQDKIHLKHKGGGKE